MRVQEQQRPRRGALQDLRAHQPFVEHDQMIGFVDLVAVGDGRTIDPRVGLYRRAGPFAAVIAEGLHRKSHLGEQHRDELGAGDAALAAAAVNAHLQRQDQAGRKSAGRRCGRILGVHQVSRFKGAVRISPDWALDS